MQCLLGSGLHKQLRKGELYGSKENKDIRNIF